MIIRCLPVEVYRNGCCDCSNNGISKTHNSILVACPKGHYTFDSEQGTPDNFCMVEDGYFGDQYIVPAMVDNSGRIVKRPGCWMDGGNIAYTSDSRFHELKGNYFPLNIHDRKE